MNNNSSIIYTMKHKFFGLLIIWILIISLISTGCAQDEETYGFDSEKGLIAIGYVELEEVNINAKTPGKIAKLNVQEGQNVAPGDVIAEIENDQLIAKRSQVEAKVDQAKKAVELQSNIIEAKINQATGAYQAAQAQLEKAQQGARDQELEQAKAYFELMQATYERIEQLYENGAVAAQKLDEAKAELKVAEEKYKLAQEGAQAEDISAAEGLLKQAEGALAEANASKLQVQLAQQQYEEALAALEEVDTLIEDTKIKAPRAGIITEVNCKEGELVSSGMPIAKISDFNNILINVNIYETELQAIKLNQEVLVKFPSTGDAIFKGTVAKISSKSGFATKKATNNLDRDILAYKVVVKLQENGENNIFPGMTSYVQFVNHPELK